jgi:hypothetical protein
MRLKFVFSFLASLVAVLAATSATLAGGDCGAPAYNACCPTDCCYPKVKYKTVWHDVYEHQTRTVCKPVYKTIMKEVEYTVCKPVYETVVQDCKRIVCKPVWEEKQVKVCCGEWATEQVYCPGPVVTKRCKLPDTCCYDPCSCCPKVIPGKEVCYQVQCPGKWVCKKVWVPREEIRTVKVCRMVQEEICEKVSTQVCRHVQERCVKLVPVTICEKVPTCETVCVKRRVKCQVPVCEDSCEEHVFHRLKNRLHGLFRHGDECCDTCGYGAHYAPAGAPAPAPEKAPMPKEAPAKDAPAKIGG